MNSGPPAECNGFYNFKIVGNTRHSVNLAFTWGKPSKGWLRDDFLETALTVGKTQKGQWGMTFTSTCTGQNLVIFHNCGGMNIHKSRPVWCENQGAGFWPFSLPLRSSRILAGEVIYSTLPGPENRSAGLLIAMWGREPGCESLETRIAHSESWRKLFAPFLRRASLEISYQWQLRVKPPPRFGICGWSKDWGLRQVQLFAFLARRGACKRRTWGSCFFWDAWHFTSYSGYSVPFPHLALQPVISFVLWTVNLSSTFQSAS